MKAYLTTIKEKTTDICGEQLSKFGFDVVVLDKIEPWIDKYKRFIKMADEDCLRIDADIILNKRIIKGCDFYAKQKDYWMIEFNGWCFYKNDIGVIGCVFYKKECLDILKNNLDKLDHGRPEASAWRLKEILPHTYNDSTLVGIHGIYQDEDNIRQAIRNKTDRNQLDDYDFGLALRLNKL